MNNRSLKSYISKIYQLETAKCALELLRNRVIEEIDRLESLEDCPPLQPSPVHSGDLLTRFQIVLGIAIGSAALLLILWFGGEFFASMAGLSNGPGDPNSPIEPFLQFSAIAMICIFPGCMLALLVIAAKNILANLAHNRSIALKNEEIARLNARKRERIDRAVAALRQQLDLIDAKYDEARRLLSEFYRMNRVDEKYRNLSAIRSFLVSLFTGRCSRLEGPDGAYQIFESEASPNLGWSSPEASIKSLDPINRVSRQMFSMVDPARSQSFEIDDDAVISAYYRSISTILSGCEEWLSGNRT